MAPNIYYINVMVNVHNEVIVSFSIWLIKNDLLGSDQYVDICHNNSNFR